MTGDVAQALAAMLRQQPHLRALNLNDTSLEDAGITTIAHALADSGMLAPAHKALVKNLSVSCVWNAGHYASVSSMP